MVDLAHIQALFSFPLCRLLLAHVRLDKLSSVYSSTCGHRHPDTDTWKHSARSPVHMHSRRVFPCLCLFPFSFLNTHTHARAHTRAHKHHVPTLDKCSKTNFSATESPPLPNARAVQRLGWLAIGRSEASLVGDWPERAPGAQRQ